MKRSFKFLGAALLAMTLMLALYFGIAWAMLMFPANSGRATSADAETIAAYVISNGVHTDLVFPVKSPQIDWTAVFRTRDFLAPPPQPRFIAIGWGDREFYLNTKEIADITARRAIGALIGGHRTLIHVNYLANLDFSTSRYALPLTPHQYQTLIDHVLGATVLHADGSATVIPGQHYDRLDAFYEAHGTYSLFNTCNTWTGDALRQAGARVSHWTPLASMVVWHLPPAPAP